MAKNRNSKIRPAKAFENAQAAVLLVDSDFVIRYANPAACTWLETPVEELVGLKTTYTTGELDNAMKNRVLGICPSPEVFEGYVGQQGVFRKNADGKKVWRQAISTALNIAGQDMALIVAIEPDLVSPPETQDSRNSSSLRQQLAAIREKQKSSFNIDSLVGVSAFAERTRRQVVAASENRAETIVIGEKGTGREHIARTIFSSRCNDGQNLYPIHCQIADPQLIQTAIKQWIEEQRNDRTHDWLLLLEVDKLEPVAQTELLGFAQLPGFQLRTISTSSQHLNELVEQGDFSADLAAYLSTQVIETVPLRNRREDIPLMAQAFVERSNQSIDKQVSTISPAAMELLIEFPWKHNADQLQDFVSRAIQKSKTTVIQVDDLPEDVQFGLEAVRIGRHQDQEIKLDEFLQSIEKQLIERAMRQAKSNKSKAASLLGISRPRLLRRLESLGVIKSSTPANDDNVIDSSAFEEADS